MSAPKALSVNDLKDIQAGPVVQIPTKSTYFLFFGIADATAFRSLFGRHILPFITPSEEARNLRSTVYELKEKRQMCTLAGITVSFSNTGLIQFFPNENIGDQPFTDGQLAAAETLGDTKSNWLSDFIDNQIDGLFEISGHPAEHVEDVAKQVKSLLGDSISVIFEHSGQVRPGDQKGHEHFGFNDGLSQPYVHFEDDGHHRRAPLPGQTEVNPGVLVLGQPGDPNIAVRPKWALNGSIQVYRHLKQLVPEFDAFLRSVVLKTPFPKPDPPTPCDEDEIQKRINYLGARLMGRWKSGTPVVLSMTGPGPIPADDPSIGGNKFKNNNFNFEGNQSLCPFAAHVRKTGPRKDIGDNRAPFSIQRGGITYGPEVTKKERSVQKTFFERGLSFVCFQSSMEGAHGFQFIQRSWCNNVNFRPGTDVTPGFDPIIGQKNGQERKMTGYDTSDLSKELTIPQEFIIAQGGEYFFLPSISTLKLIAGAKY